MSEKKWQCLLNPLKPCWIWQNKKMPFKFLSLVYIKGNDNLMQRNSICSLRWEAVSRADGFCFLITSWHIKQTEDPLSTSGVNFTCGSCLIKAHSGGFQLSSGSEAVGWAPRGVVKKVAGEIKDGLVLPAEIAALVTQIRWAQNQKTVLEFDYQEILNLLLFIESIE